MVGKKGILWASGAAGLPAMTSILNTTIRSGACQNMTAVRLWEKLVLDGFQAGLSWLTILKKREAFRAAFADFDPIKVAKFDETDVERLMQTRGLCAIVGK